MCHFQIERLKSLLAAESGNFASTVQTLEDRHRATQKALTKELSLTREALAAMMKQYTYVKQIFNEAESRLRILGERDTTNRVILGRLIDKLAKISSEKHILSDRLDELESRLAWSASTVPCSTAPYFAFKELDFPISEVHAHEVRVNSLNETISQLESQIERLEKTSESLTATNSLFQQTQTLSLDLFQTPLLKGAPDPLCKLPKKSGELLSSFNPPEMTIRPNFHSFGVSLVCLLIEREHLPVIFQLKVLACTRR